MKKKILVFISSCFMAAALAGCGATGMSEDTAEKTMLDNLHSKYDQGFVIESVEKKDVGQNFAVYRYFFRVVDGEQGAFDASMDEDGEHPDDNYAIVLFGEDIENELRAILGKYPGLAVESFLPRYELTEKTWTSREDYMKSEDFCLWCDIKPTASTEDEAIREVHKWMTDMNEKGYGFQVMIRYGEKSLSLWCDDNHPLKTETDLLETWRETDE